MTEPTTALEAEAIAWAANIIASVQLFQEAVGGTDVATTLPKILESDGPAAFGSHAVVEVDEGDLRRDGAALQGLIVVSITLLLQPVSGLTETDNLRRVRNVTAAVRRAFGAWLHVIGAGWRGPARLPDASAWPAWYGSAIMIRVLGSE